MVAIIFCYSLLMLSVMYTGELLLALHVPALIGIIIATVVNIGVLVLALCALEKGGMIK